MNQLTFPVTKRSNTNKKTSLYTFQIRSDTSFYVSSKSPTNTQRKWRGNSLTILSLHCLPCSKYFVIKREIVLIFQPTDLSLNIFQVFVWGVCVSFDVNQPLSIPLKSRSDQLFVCYVSISCEVFRSP